MNPSTEPPVELHPALEPLLTRVRAAFHQQMITQPAIWRVFLTRLQAHFPTLFSLYVDLYSTADGQQDHLEDLLIRMAKACFRRPADLHALDAEREANPGWFKSHKMLGGVIYVDLFADNLEGVRSKIPYFQELGLTYLHLMPIFATPAGENDGGYAISSYRQVQPCLGTMRQLAALSRDLRRAGISLVLDFVFNHTSDEHEWAQRAKKGEAAYLDFYLTFPDRTVPDAYERTLREIFPDEHPGAFSYIPELRRWVWTTFHRYQWDLNYANPRVFNHMADEMLFLTNQGAEVLRLDAVAFTWKQLGTSCENLPGAHKLIRAFNAIARIVCPALLFKSEAIVHPDDVIQYIDSQECQLSYNPLVMALLWNSLATRQVNLLAQALASHHKIPPLTAWVNYVRCHDDIGWTFSDEAAGQLGIYGFHHRQFLNEFYRGRFPGSFARGLPFQENPKTGDCRISGTCASLAGLEKALQEEGPYEVEIAIRRILLIHGIILTLSGIPLLYLGDEIGTLNDYRYRDEPTKAGDSRWVHRPRADWDKYARRHSAADIEGRIYLGFKKLIELRKRYDVFSSGDDEVFNTGNEHVLGVLHTANEKSVVMIANFSDSRQDIEAATFKPYLNGRSLLYGKLEKGRNALHLEPCAFILLADFPPGQP